MGRTKRVGASERRSSGARPMDDEEVGRVGSPSREGMGGGCGGVGKGAEVAPTGGRGE